MIKKKDKYQEFKEIVALEGGEIVQEFDNSGKERFVVYKYPEMPAYLVTGDEFDWEMGWMLQKGDYNEAICIFQFSGEEKQELQRMWARLLSNEQQRFESTHRGRKFTPSQVDTTKPEEAENGDSGTEDTATEEGE